MRERRSAAVALAAGVAGAVLGGGVEAGATMLLYADVGLLATAGFLIALALAAVAAALWVGAPGRRPSSRGRWIGAFAALALASLYATLWMRLPALAETGVGRALAVVVLMAGPAYALGSVLAALQERGRGVAAAALAGAAVGVALAGAVLIPRLDPDAFFRGAAVLVLVTGAVEGWWLGPKDGRMERVAIITGVGAPGQVGYALAEAFLARGAAVVVAGPRPEIEAHAASLAAGGPVLGVQADVTREEEADRVVVAARERFGRVDVLVNAAGGLSVVRPLAETSPEEWEHEMERNARTAFVMSRAALPALRESRGAIVNFASPAGVRARPRLGAYSAAKAAVVALTRAMALEEREHGVRVNAVAPGMIDTEQNRRAVDDPDAVRWVSREQVAEVVLFLASDAAAAVTGETVHVTGGE